MNVNWISQSCAKQRAGRAGRLCAGECYRLYTREHHNHMATHDVPEILRMPLQVIILYSVITYNPGLGLKVFSYFYWFDVKSSRVL